MWMKIYGQVFSEYDIGAKFGMTQWQRVHLKYPHLHHVHYAFSECRNTSNKSTLYDLKKSSGRVLFTNTSSMLYGVNMEQSFLSSILFLLNDWLLTTTSHILTMRRVLEEAKNQCWRSALFFGRIADPDPLKIRADRGSGSFRY